MGYASTNFRQVGLETLNQSAENLLNIFMLLIVAFESSRLNHEIRSDLLKKSLCTLNSPAVMLQCLPSLEKLVLENQKYLLYIFILDIIKQHS